ncbi:glycosyltransferase [Rossellomorea marisflavi]|uniref:glycosyltransferase n=1 Tax=Rossellomorea marisflavi TaxID=189381 RepID=UPI0006A9ABE1|nr:glycosyltransferase [Rossellomorea marisflavi]
MISVAMTTYNGEKYITKQLQSIYEQQLQPDEVIIVDDCSTDNTVKIVSEFINNRELFSWKLITFPENKGFINSFKRAIYETSGDIIFLCDQDDIWLKNKISLMSKVMIENPKILSLSSSFIKIDDNDNEIKTKEIPFSSNNNLIRKRIKNNNCIKISSERVVAYNISPGCTSAFRSSIKEDFEYAANEEVDLVHDWKINFIASLNEGLYFLNTPTILYRLHQNNTLGLTRDTSLQSRALSCIKSAGEREIMKTILTYFIESEKIENNKKTNNLLQYLDRLKSSQIEREYALKNRNILKLIHLVFKYNLFKNRIVETILVDISSILNKSRI